MQQPFTKREVIISITSALLIIAAAILIFMLQQSQLSKDRVIQSQAASLNEKTVNANDTLEYIDTICGEYRKLYQSYRAARYPDPNSVDKYVGLPGSAKGQIDDCYLPQ